MEMPVLCRHCLAGQPALVEICDVVVVRVEQVEGGQRDGKTFTEAAAELQIDQRGRIGTHAAILDEWRRTEMPEARAAEPAARVLYRHAQRRDALDRAWNVIARRRLIRRRAGAEAPSRPGQVGIQREPFAGSD